MIAEFSLLSAFVAGLLGGVHCVGMCGGIVAALSLGSRSAHPGGAAVNWPVLLGYNLGRLSSYAFAGALAGGIGALFLQALPAQLVRDVMTLVAAVFMLLLGLYIGGWFRVLSRVEQMGMFLWRRIEPFTRKLLPVTLPSQAVLLGLLWGWLPCGLVYSMLIWSISSGDALSGALIMLAFGIGTLPNLLAMGMFADRLRSLVQNPGVRALAGGSLIALGLLVVVLHFTDASLLLQ